MKPKNFYALESCIVLCLWNINTLKLEEDIKHNLIFLWISLQIMKCILCSVSINTWIRLNICTAASDWEREGQYLEPIRLCCIHMCWEETCWQYVAASSFFSYQAKVGAMTPLYSLTQTARVVSPSWLGSLAEGWVIKIVPQQNSCESYIHPQMKSQVKRVSFGV